MKFVIEDEVLIKVLNCEENIVIPEGVTSIGYCAFECCKNLTSITISNSVTSIGNCAFYGCKNLKSITIPDSVTSIGCGVFKKCENLTSITISNSVTSIGNYAFECCKNLKSITIPDSVTSIGNYAFYDCKNLKSITIPDSVTSIGDCAFYDCKNLKSCSGKYKATDEDLQCIDFQYTVGEWTPNIEDIKLCYKGYHYVTNLFDIFNYYSGKLGKYIRIFEVETKGDSDETNEDSKRVCRSIKLVRELSREEIIALINT